MPVTSVPNSYARRVYETLPSDSTQRRRDVNTEESVDGLLSFAEQLDEEPTENAEERRAALKIDALVKNEVLSVDVGGILALKQIMKVTGALMSYYDTLPEGSPERTELQHQVTALHDAHSDLGTALQRITRACLHVREAINPTPEDDD